MVLQEVSEMLQYDIREADLPIRWGGEELAILLPETDPEGANILAEKLRYKIENHLFEEVGKVTASFGVATMAHDSKVGLLSSADKTLYEAKQKGRNKVVLFSDIS